MFRQIKFVIRHVNCGCVSGVLLLLRSTHFLIEIFPVTIPENEANRTIKVEWEFHHLYRAICLLAIELHLISSVR